MKFDFSDRNSFKPMRSKLDLFSSFLSSVVEIIEFNRPLGDEIDRLIDRVLVENVKISPV